MELRNSCLRHTSKYKNSVKKQILNQQNGVGKPIKSDQKLYPKDVLKQNAYSCSNVDVFLKVLDGMLYNASDVIEQNIEDTCIILHQVEEVPGQDLKIMKLAINLITISCTTMKTF